MVGVGVLRGVRVGPCVLVAVMDVAALVKEKAVRLAACVAEILVFVGVLEIRGALKVRAAAGGVGVAAG